VGGTVDRFGTSGSAFAHAFQYITSPAPLPPVYLSTSLQHTTLAVTTQINDELGKCTASQSNTRSRSYGNKQYRMLQYYSFWFC